MDNLIAAALAAAEAQQQSSEREDDDQQDQEDASPENECGVNDCDSVARNPCRSCALFFCGQHHDRDHHDCIGDDGNNNDFFDSHIRGRSEFNSLLELFTAITTVALTATKVIEHLLKLSSDVSLRGKAQTSSRLIQYLKDLDPPQLPAGFINKLLTRTLAKDILTLKNAIDAALKLSNGNECMRLAIDIPKRQGGPIRLFTDTSMETGNIVANRTISLIHLLLHPEAQEQLQKIQRGVSNHDSRTMQDEGAVSVRISWYEELVTIHNRVRHTFHNMLGHKWSALADLKPELGSFKDGTELKAMKTKMMNELNTLKCNAETSGRNESGLVLDQTVYDK